jgi:plastocyanin
MPNGVRNSIWALFFLAGMAFTATLIFMIRPDLFSANSAVREKPGSSVILAGNAPRIVEVPPPPPIRQSEPPESEIEAVAPRPRQANSQPEPPAVKENDSAHNRMAKVPVQSTVAEVATTSAVTPHVPVEAVRHVSPGGSVFGHVSLVGALSAPKIIPVADGFCGPHTHATSIVSRVYMRAPDNSLADVLVYLNGGREFGKRHWIAPPQTAAIANRNCQFEPYITAIQLGQSVEFENLDPILHNVHVVPKNSRNRSINLALMPKSRPATAEFKEVEAFIRVECNVHPYMVAYICVMPHPFFALTKEDGNFHISNVPDGDYEVTAMHRKLGSIVKKQVTVKHYSSPEIEFVFEAPTEIAQKE